MTGSALKMKSSDKHSMIIVALFQKNDKLDMNGRFALVYVDRDYKLRIIHKVFTFLLTSN